MISRNWLPQRTWSAELLYDLPTRLRRNARRSAPKPRFSNLCLREGVIVERPKNQHRRDSGRKEKYNYYCVMQDTKYGRILEVPVGPGDSPQVREEKFGGGAASAAAIADSCSGRPSSYTLKWREKKNRNESSYDKKCFEEPRGKNIKRWARHNMREPRTDPYRDSEEIPSGDSKCRKLKEFQVLIVQSAL